ncbi:uncharacterized protein LOC134077909 [Sardina pilchardus]|uniref:uncharacterized protein LOC134077909 n=1 Tax=Sardina pilchardus TaxID=27697 RepID=UPI002E100B84
MFFADMRAFCYHLSYNNPDHLPPQLWAWPLSSPQRSPVHFRELTGVDLKGNFSRNLDLKGQRLLNFLTTVCVPKNKKLLETYARIQRIRGQESGCSEDVKEMLLLLLTYFDEKEESLFCYVDDTCLAEEVQLEQVPLTPALIVCGQSCFSAARYMLSLDRNLINSNISFISALCLMFESYFCFNIHFPSELASTLEFLQRCFYSNPEKGTKVAKNSVSPEHEPTSPHPDTGHLGPRVA